MVSTLTTLTKRDGDLKVEWDKDNPEEVQAAREAFDNAMRSNKMAAFRTWRDGSRGEQIREFDPEAERIVVGSAPQGG